MLESEYAKRTRADRRHQQRMEAIYAKRGDICRNCVFFKDWRFCVNPKHAEGNRWADSAHVVGSVRVSATQGCELFERGPAPEIREADPEEEAERLRHSAEVRAIYDAGEAARKATRMSLELAVQNKVGPIRNIVELDTETLRRLAQ